MTWLREIDRIYGTIEEHSRAFGEVQLIRRMARVIREQSAYIRASHALEKACCEFNPVDFDSLEKARSDAWDNLSTDAKEVIDELAK